MDVKITSVFLMLNIEAIFNYRNNLFNRISNGYPFRVAVVHGNVSF